MQAQQLNYNFRGIILTDGVHQANKSLCERCHHPICSSYTAFSCKDFTPALKFKPPLLGFDQAKFNTFRMGTAWAKRLEVGSLVAIINAKTDEVFGYANLMLEARLPAECKFQKSRQGRSLID